jgi:formate dehydrogenase major subunit
MGENIMVSDPDVKHVEEALHKVNFLVVQDIFLTETAALADVVLPAACFAEKDGTFTNTERRVQRVRKAVNPPGEARADWQVLSDLIQRLGHSADYQSPAEIMAEIARVTPQYRGIDYDRIDAVGLQWPCPDRTHPGTKFLHSSHIARGRGLLVPVEHADSQELPDDEYPLILTTGRILYHYHTRTMTGRVEGLDELAPASFVEISPATAGKLGIENGEMVTVTSRRGSISTQARVTKHIKDGVVFIPFHFAKGNANVLTNVALDPVAQIPELKVAAVKVKRGQA